MLLFYYYTVANISIIQICIKQSGGDTNSYNMYMELTFRNNRIAELRKETGLSQRALAKQLATSQANVSRWELGTTEPSVIECWRIAEFFNVSIDYLCGRADF